ncbi:MAG: hypothetical protein ABS81_19725 [Pseudonocardia sp. SCN 72-86]|nr:MAG: hypothetical protein ABS81_19725 [Pseudonocardia sp. SCN 72-86]
MTIIGIPAVDDRRRVWSALLERQHGMASLTQLQELGISWSAVVAQTKAGRWRRHLPRVYATVRSRARRASAPHCCTEERMRCSAIGRQRRSGGWSVTRTGPST